MELENHTPFPAALFRGVIDEERLFASMVARVTYDLVNATLTVAEKQSWKISPGPWQCEHGLMVGDELFYRGGVDLFVLGTARPAGGRPATRVDVTAEVGDHFRHSVAVFGDRIWQQQDGQPVPSQPQPFDEIPLTLANAFGGKDEWDELPIPNQDNPDGRGYYLSADSALGKPLPNIEDPDRPVRAWDDRPDPVGVGLCPMGFGPRLQQSVEIDEKTGQMSKLHPTFFNAAFPGMVVPRATAGDQVRVGGVQTEGPITFALPASGLRVRLGFGDQVSEHEPPIDQIGVEVDHSRVFITYRYPFRYKMIPLQKRSCDLLWNGVGGSR